MPAVEFTARDNTVANSRWKRDSGIAELIEYFDQEKFILNPETGEGNWDAVSDIDFEEIVKQVNLCRKDYSYAARNYFWITNKDRRDVLFTPNESQEIALERIFAIRARGVCQRVIILKARQLGMSLLSEGLLAWGTLFNANTNAAIVGPDKNRSEYLFSLLLHIYDHLPWWLRPMVSTRRYKDGLTLDNPDPTKRRVNPGLNSRIEVQSAQQYSGIGQGIRLSMAHISELSDMPDSVAKDIIQEDLGNALAVSSPGTMAIVESTAKGSGRYYHKFYMGNKEDRDAAWETIFIPAFMERSRFIAPPEGWRPHKIELEYRDNVKTTWLRCDNSECLKFKERWLYNQDYTGTKCEQCDKGRVRPYDLSDPEIRWMELARRDAEKTGADSIKSLRQEMATTETEAFQLSGDQVFPDDCLAWASRCSQPPLFVGDIDEHGNIHGMIRRRGHEDEPAHCYQEWCTKNHTWDNNFLHIWELPQPGCNYAMGVDVAEGLGGEHDYSVIAMVRLGSDFHPDIQVATWRSNEVNHYDLALPVVLLGLAYNEALCCVEYTNYQTCGDRVLWTYAYPNIYRWKHPDSVNPNSNKYHWITNGNSKPKLWGNMVQKLRANLFYPRSRNLVEEMKTFSKADEDDRKAEADSGFKDDELIAVSIALYCGRENEMDYNFVEAQTKNGKRVNPGAKVDKNFDCTCMRCNTQFDSELDPMDPQHRVRCPQCGCIILKSKRRDIEEVKTRRLGMQDLAEVAEFMSDGQDRTPEYDSL